MNLPFSGFVLRRQNLVWRNTGFSLRLEAALFARVPQQEQGQLGVEALLGPKVLEQQAVSVLVVWFEMPPSFRKEHRGTGALLVFLVRRQGRYFGVKQGMPFLTFRRPRWPSQQEPLGDGSGRQIEWVDLPERRDGGAVWRLAEEGPQLGRLSEVVFPMLFMRRSLRVQRSGSG